MVTKCHEDRSQANKGLEKHKKQQAWELQPAAVEKRVKTVQQTMEQVEGSSSEEEGEEGEMENEEEKKDKKTK